MSLTLEEIRERVGAIQALGDSCNESQEWAQYDAALRDLYEAFIEEVAGNQDADTPLTGSAEDVLGKLAEKAREVLKAREGRV